MPDPNNPPDILEPTTSGPSTGGTAEAIRTLLGSQPDPVPRYVLGEVLGRGGMGEVYAAHDVRLRRTIALKSLKKADPGEAVIARFLREAQVTGQLEHPNVVPVYDIGLDAQGRVFYTMKRVQGRSLAQLVRDGKGGRVTRLRIFLQVCDAIAYAHDRGVVHRDLKPANVMLGEFGEVLVLDWGIARRTGDAVTRPVHDGTADGELDDLTQDDVVLGTPSWMSPEQAAGAHVSPAADQYGLGAILYLLLTSKPAFLPGKGVLDLVAAGTFRPPRAVAPDVPRELEAIVLKAMARNPSDRYPSVVALRDDVSAYLEGRPVVALRYTTRDRARRWAARNWRPIVVAAAAVGALSIGTGTAVALVAGVWTLGATAARDVAVAAEGAATRQLAETRVALALVDVEAGRIEAAASRLEDARAAWAGVGEADPPLLALARSYLAWREDGAPVAWAGAEFVGADVSPDGRRVLACERDGTFYRLDGVTGALLAQVTPDDVLDATFTRFVDGREWLGWTAAVPGGREQRWAEWQADGTLGALHALPLPPTRSNGDTVLVSDDGRRLLIADQRVQVHALPGGEPVGAGVDGVWLVRASGDHGRIVGRRRASGAYLRAAVDLGVWDALTGEELWYQREEGHGVLSADGSRLAVLSGDPPRVRLIDPALGIVRWSEIEERATDLVFLPDDGGLAVIAGERARVRALDDGRPIGWLPRSSGVGDRFATGGAHTFDAARGELEVRPWRPDRPDRAIVQLPPGKGIRAVDVTRDGLLAAVAGNDGILRIYDPIGGQPLRAMVGNPCTQDNLACGSRDVAFDADGRRVVSADRDGRVRMWDVASGRPSWIGEAGLGIVGGLAWDDHHLVSTHEDGSLVVWDPATGAERARYRGGITSAWAVHLHPDGRRAVVTGRAPHDPQLEVWDLVAGELLASADRNGPAYRGAFSPDGKIFAVGTSISGVWAWDLSSRPLRGERWLDSADTMLSVAFTPDGSQILVGWMSGRLSVRDVARSTELVALPLHQTGAPSAIQDIVVRADGRVYTAGDDGRLVAFDLRPTDPEVPRFRLGEPADVPTLQRSADRAAAWGDWSRVAALHDAILAAGGEVSALARLRSARERGAQLPSGETGLPPAIAPVFAERVLFSEGEPLPDP